MPWRIEIRSVRGARTTSREVCSRPSSFAAVAWSPASSSTHRAQGRRGRHRGPRRL